MATLFLASFSFYVLSRQGATPILHESHANKSVFRFVRWFIYLCLSLKYALFCDFLSITFESVNHAFCTTYINNQPIKSYEAQ